jgi:DNA-binding response OmpR family regulator
MVCQTILVVNDEPHIADVMRDYLKQAGFEVLTACDGRTALAVARRARPDLVVLDSTLPGDVDGLAVCRCMRRDPVLAGVPIVMLTPRDREAKHSPDPGVSLEWEADDYVTVPFNLRELVARARQVLRRARGHDAAPGVVRVGELTLNLTARSVTVAGRAVSLTPTEFDLLATLARYPDRAFTRTQLTHLVYDAAYAGYERAIDSHVSNLRRKIEPDPGKPRYLLTVCDGGYKLGRA